VDSSKAISGEGVSPPSPLSKHSSDKKSEHNGVDSSDNEENLANENLVNVDNIDESP